MKEKNIISKTLLLFCTLLAVFVSLSGTFNVNSAKELLWQLAFLPITVFLVITTINTFFFKGTSYLPDTTSAKGKANLVIAFLIFSIFFVLGVRGILTKEEVKDVHIIATKDINNPVNTVLPIAMEKGDISSEKVVTIKTDNTKTIINVRKNPDPSSPIIIQVKNGEVYEMLEESTDWVKIKIDEENSGWVQDVYIIKPQ